MTPIPVSIITGFLGSGKTTLLRRLLADPQMGEVAVLINEFGEVGLDHLLVRKVDADIVLLSSGCLCCTVRSDLVEALVDLRQKRAAGRIPPFRRVVIETTGLADPAPILHTLMTEPALAADYRLTGLVATVDALHGPEQLDEYEEAVKQAGMAEHLVITKTDLVPPAAEKALRARLARLGATGQIHRAGRAFGPEPDALFTDAIGLAPDPGMRLRPAQTAESEALHAGMPEMPEHDPDGHAAHPPGHNRHDTRIRTFVLSLAAPVAWEGFSRWLSLLLASRGDQILRLKGLLDVAGRARPVVIHGVQHVFYPPAELEAWPAGERRTRLVFITRDLAQSAVEASLRRLTG